MAKSIFDKMDDFIKKSNQKQKMNEVQRFDESTYDKPDIFAQIEDMLKPNKKTDDYLKKAEEQKEKHLQNKHSFYRPTPTKSKEEEKKSTPKKSASSFVDNLKGFLTGEKVLEGLHFRDIKKEDSDATLNKVGKLRPNEKGTEVDRFIAQASNSASLGIPKELAKRTGDKHTLDSFYNERKIGEGGGKDLIAQGLGYLAPGVGVVKGVKVVGLGAKEGTKGLAKLGQIAKEGLFVGGALSAAEVGIREGINPNDYNWKQNASHIGVGMGTGAVADPLIHGLGSGISKGVDVGLKKLIPQDLPKFNGRVSEETLKNLTHKTSELPSQPTKPLNVDTTSNVKRYHNPNETLNDFLGKSKEDSPLLQLAKKVNHTKRELPDFSNSKPIIDNGDIISTHFGVDVPKDLVDTAPPQYWQKRYEDFVSHVNKNYDTNNLTKEGIEDLWSQFARYDEPVNLEQVVDLAYKGYKEPKNLNANEVWNQLGNRPSASKNAKNILGVDDSMFLKNKDQILKPETSSQINTLDEILPIKPSRTLQKSKDFEPIEALRKNTELYNHDYDLVEISPKERVDNLIDELKSNNPYQNNLPNTLEQLTTKTKGEQIPLKTLAKEKVNQSYINNVDNIYRLKQFTDMVEKQLGNVNPTDNPYMIGLNSRGSDMVSKEILTNHMLNHKGEVVGKSFKDIALKVPKGKLEQFEDYLINKHAITRMDRGEKVFADKLEMTPEKAAAKVVDYETNNPDFIEIAKEYYDYNKQLGEKWLVDTGIIPKDVWEGYTKNNPYYVSNERWFSDLEATNQNNQAKKGFANQSNPVKKGVGSQRKIVSPFETTIERTSKYVKTARRNEVMQSLIKNLQRDPETFKGWAEIVPTEKNPSAYMDSLQNTLEKDGIESVLEEFNKAFEQKPDLTRGNIVTGIVDGKKVHVKVNDPQLLEALTNLTPQAQGRAIELVGNVTRMMKTLTTGLNPMFSLLRNVWRDIPSAYINSKTTNNPLTFTKDITLAMFDVFGNKESYQAFKAIGGGHSSPISSDVNLLAQSKREILGSKGLRAIPEKGISAIENLSNIVEAAPRLAEFKRIAKNGDYDSKLKGLYEANDITVNFNRFGNNVKQLDAIIPYLNAATQGLDKLARVYKDNPVQGVAKTVVGVTIPTSIFYALNYTRDYENYKKLPAYVRDSNYLFPLGDGEFIKIPKPRETGIVFSALFERNFQEYAEKDPHAFEGFANSLLNNFVPPTRLISAPFDDLRANKDFADRPIVSGDLQNLSPKYQFDENTSEVSKFIGDKLNVSPKQLDYIAKSYTGILGQLGIPATAKGSTLGDTFKKQVIADSVYQNNIVERFYKTKNKLDTANYDFNATGIQSENYDNDLRKTFGKLSREMSDVRKEIKSVEKDEDLSRKERKEKLRNLQLMINSIAEKGNNLKEGR